VYMSKLQIDQAHLDQSDHQPLSVSLDFNEILGSSNSPMENKNDKQESQEQAKRTGVIECNIQHQEESFSPLNFSILKKTNDEENIQEQDEKDKTLEELENHFPSEEKQIKEVHGIAPEGHVYNWVDEKTSSTFHLRTKDKQLVSSDDTSSESENEIHGKEEHMSIHTNSNPEKNPQSKESTNNDISKLLEENSFQNSKDIDDILYEELTDMGLSSSFDGAVIRGCIVKGRYFDSTDLVSCFIPGSKSENQSEENTKTPFNTHNNHAENLTSENVNLFFKVLYSEPIHESNIYDGNSKNQKAQSVHPTYSNNTFACRSTVYTTPPVNVNANPIWSCKYIDGITTSSNFSPILMKELSRLKKRDMLHSKSQVKIPYGTNHHDDESPVSPPSNSLFRLCVFPPRPGQTVGGELLFNCFIQDNNGPSIYVGQITLNLADAINHQKDAKKDEVKNVSGANDSKVNCEEKLEEDDINEVIIRGWFPLRSRSGSTYIGKVELYLELTLTSFNSNYLERLLTTDTHKKKQRNC